VFACKARKTIIVVVCLFLMILAIGSLASAEDFAFMVIADPHIDGTAAHATRLQSCINWINANKTTKKIELVFVVGDIGWSGRLSEAKTLLDGLTVPYIPLMGDNEFQAGSEVEFNNVFSPQYAYLAGILTNWQKASVPVWNPQISAESYLQNFSFDHHACHFICADFAARYTGTETAELHNFTGGTWPWFKNDVINCQKTKTENIVSLSHHGMFINPYLFNSSQMSTITAFTGGYKSYLHANYSGHVHLNWTQGVPLFFSHYTGITTDATFEDDNTMRRVAVTIGSLAVSYAQELVVIP
jgi:hypothetical protein